MTVTNTCDIVDAHRASGSIQTCSIQFRQFGARSHMWGSIRTVRVFEDNGLIRQALSEPGNGRILVIDGAGSLRVALMGGIVAAMTVTSGWAGLVVWGAVRDAEELRTLPIGLKALGTNPMSPEKTGAGQLDIPVVFGDATFKSGDWIYSDDDGIVIGPGPLI